MKFVIMGCGRVGAKLASELSAEGHDVCIIDKSPSAFARLTSDYSGMTVQGTGIDEDVLRKAGIEEADGFVALTEDDNANIMASQIARLVFNVPKITTRIYDPLREDLFKELGLKTICPTKLGAQHIKDALEKGIDAGNCALW